MSRVFNKIYIKHITIYIDINPINKENKYVKTNYDLNKNRDILIMI
jgi:hypothetical protein